jgi:hypothetical protein
VAAYFGAAAYSPALGAAAAALEPKRQAEGWASHAQLVVARVAAGGGRGGGGGGCGGCGGGGGGSGCDDSGGGGDGGDSGRSGSGPGSGAPSPDAAAAALEAFVKEWRRHFLATMRPRHLPAFWSVDARVANSSSAAPVSCSLALPATEL